MHPIFCVGLFHHAISLSGTALNPSLRPTSNPNPLVKQLGLTHKCQNDNDVELVDCLRDVNASQFANITSMRFVSKTIICILYKQIKFFSFAQRNPDIKTQIILNLYKKK